MPAPDESKCVGIDDRIGLLDHRSPCLVGHQTRLKENRLVAGFTQFGNALLDGSGSRLTVAFAVAIALRQVLWIIVAKIGPRQGTDLQFNYPLDGKADHLPR